MLVNMRFETLVRTELARGYKIVNVAAMTSVKNIIGRLLFQTSRCAARWLLQHAALRTV